MRMLALTNFLFAVVLSLVSATTLTDEEIAKILSDTSRPEIPLSNLRDYEHSQQLGNLRDKLRTLDLNINDQDGGDIFPNEDPDVLDGGALDNINMIDRDSNKPRYGRGWINTQRLGLRPIGNLPFTALNEEGEETRTDSSGFGYSKRKAPWRHRNRYSGISVARRGTGRWPTRDDLRRNPASLIPLAYHAASNPYYNGRDIVQRSMRQREGPYYFSGSDDNGNTFEKRFNQKGRYSGIMIQRRNGAGVPGLVFDGPPTGSSDVDYLKSSMVGHGPRLYEEYYPVDKYSPPGNTWYGSEESDVRAIRHVRPKRVPDDRLDQYNTKRIVKRAATNRGWSRLRSLTDDVIAQSQTRKKRAVMGFLNTPKAAGEDKRSWKNVDDHDPQLEKLKLIVKGESGYTSTQVNNNGVRSLDIYPSAISPYVPVTRGLGHDVMSGIFTRLTGQPGDTRQQYRHTDPGNSRWFMLASDEVESVLSRNRGTGSINNGHIPGNNRLNGVDIDSNDISVLSDDDIYDSSENSLTKRNLFCNRRTGCGRKRGKRERLSSDLTGGICSRLKCEAKRVLCNRNGCRSKRVGSMITRLYCKNFMCSTLSHRSANRPLGTSATVVQEEDKNFITDQIANGAFQQVELSNGEQPEKNKVETKELNSYAKQVLYDIIMNSLVRHKDLNGDRKFKSLI